jgi:hypothetical protein
MAASGSASASASAAASVEIAWVWTKTGSDGWEPKADRADVDRALDECDKSIPIVMLPRAILDAWIPRVAREFPASSMYVFWDFFAAKCNTLNLEDDGATILVARDAEALTLAPATDTKTLQPAAVLSEAKAWQCAISALQGKRVTDMTEFEKQLRTEVIAKRNRHPDWPSAAIQVFPQEPSLGMDLNSAADGFNSFTAAVESSAYYFSTWLAARDNHVGVETLKDFNSFVDGFTLTTPPTLVLYRSFSDVAQHSVGPGRADE